MTRWEMLEQLTTDGEDNGSQYHDGLEGWFGWTVYFANGEAVLNVTFEDEHTITEYEWTLNPKEAK